MNGRESIVNNFFHHTVSTWTLPGGISCDDDDDQARLERFLAKHPRIEKAVAKYIAHAAATPAHRTAEAAAMPTPATNPAGDVEVPVGVAPEPQRVYNPRWDRDGDGIPNRHDHHYDARRARVSDRLANWQDRPDARSSRNWAR